MVVRRAIELHIEELVLHGFAPHDRHAIADAVRDELAAKLEEGGLGLSEDLSIERLDGGTIALPRRGGAAAGRSIGAALHTTLGHADADTDRHTR
jgi:hypothetical protein